MKKELICIACPLGCHLTIDIDKDYSVSGNKCKRGEVYGKKELINPTRIITSTVKIVGGIHERIPVKSNGEIPKKLIFDVMKELDEIEVKSPVVLGDVVIKNVLNTGVDIVASRSM
jgi:CxxC motif-containing protein